MVAAEVVVVVSGDWLPESRLSDSLEVAPAVAPAGPTEMTVAEGDLEERLPLATACGAATAAAAPAEEGEDGPTERLADAGDWLSEG